MAGGFYYSDGVAVSEDGSYLLVVETDALRVVKVWLTGDKVRGAEGAHAHSVRLCLHEETAGRLRAAVSEPHTDGVHACWLALPCQAGSREVLVGSLPGLPAGLSKSDDGNFWVSMTVPNPPYSK